MQTSLISLSSIEFNHTTGTSIADIDILDSNLSVKIPDSSRLNTSKKDERRPINTEAQLENKPIIPIRISKITTSGENSFVLEDGTVKPTSIITLNKVVAEISKIDTRYPKTYSYFDVIGKFADFGQLSLKGQSRLLSPASSSNVNIKVSDLDVTSLSGYIKNIVGANPSQGSLNITSDLNMEDEKLYSLLNITINGFGVEQSSGQTAANPT